MTQAQLLYLKMSVEKLPSNLVVINGVGMLVSHINAAKHMAATFKRTLTTLVVNMMAIGTTHTHREKMQIVMKK